MEIRVWKLEMETLSGQCFLKSIFKMSNTYMNGSLIYESAGIALVGENGGAMGVRLGINKMQVETNQGEIYMNRKHMVSWSVLHPVTPNPHNWTTPITLGQILTIPVNCQLAHLSRSVPNAKSHLV